MLSGINITQSRELSDFPIQWLSEDADTIWDKLESPNTVLISEQMNSAGVEIGDNISLDYISLNGTKFHEEFEVIGHYRNMPLPNKQVYYADETLMFREIYTNLEFFPEDLAISSIKLGVQQDSLEEINNQALEVILFENSDDYDYQTMYENSVYFVYSVKLKFINLVKQNFMIFTIFVIFANIFGVIMDEKGTWKDLLINGHRKNQIAFLTNLEYILILLGSLIIGLYGCVTGFLFAYSVRMYAPFKKYIITWGTSSYGYQQVIYPQMNFTGVLTVGIIFVIFLFFIIINVKVKVNQISKREDLELERVE
jgi:hypothetical protein